jgi:quercetin dioxygenase-like cupin family protein
LSGSPKYLWVNSYDIRHIKCKRKMSVSVVDGVKVVDVRSLPPGQRHDVIFRVFDEIKPGEHILVVNDHEPVHLVHYLRHERRDFDGDAYTAYERTPGVWVAVIKRKNDVEPEQAERVIRTSFGEERSFSAKEFSPVPVYTGKSYRVILTYLKAKQFIPVHTPKIDLVFVVTRGKGTMVAGDQRFPVREGDVIIVPAGTKRGVVAETDMEALHLVSPPPTDADHEEVARKLQSGTFE